MTTITPLTYDDDGYPCFVSHGNERTHWDQQFTDEDKKKWIHYFTELQEREHEPRPNPSMAQIGIAIGLDELQTTSKHAQPLTFDDEGYPCFVDSNSEREHWDSCDDARRREYLDYYTYVQKRGRDPHRYAPISLTDMSMNMLWDVVPKIVADVKPVTFDDEGYPCFVKDDAERAQWDGFDEEHQKRYIDGYTRLQEEYDEPDPRMCDIGCAVTFGF